MKGLRAVVLSAHLDDAVLSLGASIARLVDTGVDVTVLTVLAGDPDSREPAGAWDRAAGFATAGEAARVRREEDRRACEVLGARAVWLPYGDEQYARGASDPQVCAAVAGAVEDADLVLVPGFPLAHPDHAWLARIALGGALARACVVLYVEQPYVVLRHPWRVWRRSAPDFATPLREVLVRAPSWTVLPARAEHRRAKRAACRAYRSQLRLLGRRPPVLWAMARYERRWGGETVAFVPRAA